ncbi:precorrin-6A reductase [Parabacteroides sp. FAFU027]|uniref:precorrin-6A reductase n=1 Tax=Parabacteroides sp. FAFU027 TaxID=2922715 RepID=UPI001FAF0220|nr:precorrin-6A reductase [Parabacteroides sp. FAFU027]
MIWLIGGTSNAIELTSRIADKSLPLLVTVTTGYGESLFRCEGVEVRTGALTPEDMTALIREKSVSMIVDASHPFAYVVSGNAMAVAKQTGLPYLRFERETNEVSANAIYVDSYADACQYLLDKPGNVLLTTGSKNLTDFVPLGADRLYPRVLPVPAGLEACSKAGIVPSHILAVIGPFSTEFNLATIRQYNIAYLVTKDSGNEGGFPEKLEAAEQAGITAVVIRRPALEYPAVFSGYDEIVEVISHKS